MARATSYESLAVKEEFATERPAGTAWSRLGGVREQLLVAATVLLLAAIWFDVTPLLRGPAPYPPEWQWTYREGVPASLTSRAFLSGAALLVLLAASGSTRARLRPRQAAFTMLVGASLLGPALQLGLLEQARGMPPVRALAQLTMHPGFTGHYTVGVSNDARRPADFLRHYPERVGVIHAKFPLSHAVTNPPGSSLFYRAVLAACEASPALRAAALSLIRGAPFLSQLSAEANQSAKLATAVVSPLLLIVLCVSACWPIAMLCRAFGAEPLAAARVGVLWTVLPGPTLMVPQVDQLVAALVAWAVGLLAGALVRWPAWPVRAIGAGVVGYAALFVSYGAAAFLCVAAGLCAGLCGADRRSLIHATRVVGLAALAATAVLALSVAFGHRPIDAFRASMAIHFGSFTLARSYWSWLLFGPWDLAIFLGAPIAMLFGSRIARGIAELVRTGASSLRDPTHRGLLAFAAALVALFLSGTLRGEVGRSAMPLMSLCLAASLLPAPETAGGARNEPTGAPAARFATLLAALLLLSCWVLRASWV